MAAINDLAISQVVAGAFLLGLQLVFRGGWTNTAFKQPHHYAAVFGGGSVFLRLSSGGFSLNNDCIKWPLNLF